MPKIDRKVILNKRQIVQDFAEILKKDNILIDEQEVKPYETDALSAYKQKPMIVILPETTDEVSKILSYCNKRRIKALDV